MRRQLEYDNFQPFGPNNVYYGMDNFKCRRDQNYKGCFTALASVSRYYCVSRDYYSFALLTSPPANSDKLGCRQTLKLLEAA